MRGRVGSTRAALKRARGGVSSARFALDGLPAPRERVSWPAEHVERAPPAALPSTGPSEPPHPEMGRTIGGTSPPRRRGRAEPPRRSLPLAALDARIGDGRLSRAARASPPCRRARPDSRAVDPIPARPARRFRALTVRRSRCRRGPGRASPSSRPRRSRPLATERPRRRRRPGLAAERPSRSRRERQGAPLDGFPAR